MDRVPRQRARGHGEKPMGRLVCQQHLPSELVVNTAAGLLSTRTLSCSSASRLLARFRSIRSDVASSSLSVTREFVDEQAHAEKRGEDQNVAGNPGGRVPVEGVEDLSEEVRTRPRPARSASG